MTASEAAELAALARKQAYITQTREARLALIELAKRYEKIAEVCRL